MSHHKPLFDMTCVIFAGGKSSRMGEDKALLPFGTFTTLAEFQYQRLSKLFNKVYISTKENKFDFKADLIIDIDVESSAPTVGFVSLFKQLKDERVFVLSVDTPFVGEEEIAILLEDDNALLDAVIAKTKGGTHPLCGIYHRSLFSTFKQMLTTQNHRLVKMLSEANSTYVLFKNEKVFLNLNHPNEYQEAVKLLKT